jgi:hypothetical protein
MDGCEPTERCGLGARKYCFGLFLAWLAQVGVEVDEARKRYEPAGVYNNGALFPGNILGIDKTPITNR